MHVDSYRNLSLYRSPRKYLGKVGITCLLSATENTDICFQLPPAGSSVLTHKSLAVHCLLFVGSNILTHQSLIVNCLSFVCKTGLRSTPSDELTVGVRVRHEDLKYIVKSEGIKYSSDMCCQELCVHFVDWLAD